MQIDVAIDLNGIDTSESRKYPALPAGQYRVMITSAGYAQTASGNGYRIPLELSVLSGEHRGRTLFEGLNVVNQNETAQQIGRQRLAEILDALGIDRDAFTDTKQIEGKAVLAAVSRSLVKDPLQREKYGDEGGFQNSVARFAPDNIAAPGQTRNGESAAPPSGHADPAPPSMTEEPPW